METDGGGNRIEALQAEVGLAKVQEKLASENKEIVSAITKLSKALDKVIPADLEKAVAPEPVDGRMLTEAVIEHLLRVGHVTLAKSVAEEAGIPVDEDQVRKYGEVLQVVEAVRSRRLDEAHAWVTKHRDALDLMQSEVPFELASLRFLSALEAGDLKGALSLARAELATFVPQYRQEVGQLMGCLAFGKRLSRSPYKHLLLPARAEHLAATLRKHACRAQGMRFDTPLAVCMHAGVRALPNLRKLASLMQTRGGGWEALPVEVDLGPSCAFHSVFVCPVSREQASRDNPPMLLQCGHVLCQHSLRKLSRGAGRFKCPYCPLEVSLAGSTVLTI